MRDWISSYLSDESFFSSPFEDLSWLLGHPPVGFQVSLPKPIQVLNSHFITQSLIRASGLLKNFEGFPGHEISLLHMGLQETILLT